MTWSPGAAVVNAPAKINISLRILGRRDDCYHFLDSVVTPVTLFDRVGLQVAPSDRSTISLVCTPAAAAPSGADNLAVRAALLFLHRHGSAAAVSIAIDKHIPTGAGLGGGSSNAAAVLRGLNALCPAAVPARELAAWALELGADVPLFLFARPARMRGIGERLEACPLSSRDPIVIAFPGVGIETHAVYAKYDDLLTMARVASSIPPLTPGQGPLRFLMHNDLEGAAFLLQPSLRSLKRRLSALGAAGALMTGSGSAMFGVWTDWGDAQRAAEQLRAMGTWARVVRMLERIPAVDLVTT